MDSFKKFALSIAPTITEASAICPTCGSPVTDEIMDDKVVDAGERMNAIARLGAEFAEWKAKKPSELTKLNIHEITLDLNELGAEIEDGFVKTIWQEKH